MDLNMEFLESTDKTVYISATSQHGGNAIVLITAELVDHSNRPHTMMTVDAVQALHGLIAFECREISPGSVVHVTFTKLRPQTNYVVYAIADSSNAKQVPITDEDKAPVQLTVATQPETLEIEWARLIAHMQLIEIKAALRTGWVKDAAAGQLPPVVLPSDEEARLGIEEAEAAMHGGGDVVMEIGESASSRKSPTIKNRKGAKGAEDGGKDSEGSSIWKHFSDWWVGPNPLLVSRIRTEFHLKEALFAAQQEAVLKKYLETGIATAEQVATLSEYCTTVSACLANGKLKKDALPQCEEFMVFRSWYKGGQVVRDSVEASLASAG